MTPFQQKGDRQAHPYVHLDIFVDGQEVPIPAGLGLTQPWSAVHTHATSGIVHIETSDVNARPMLGQFFSIWGVWLDNRCLANYCYPKTILKALLTGKSKRACSGSYPLIRTETLQLSSAYRQR